MSTFTDPRPVLRALDETEHGRGLFEVVRSFEYHVGTYPSSEFYVVPVGFVTDLGSVPWWASWYLPVAGKLAAPAVLHDYLMRETRLPYWQVHGIFREAMAVKKLRWDQREVAYHAVRLRYGTRRDETYARV